MTVDNYPVLLLKSILNDKRRFVQKVMAILLRHVFLSSFIISNTIECEYFSQNFVIRKFVFGVLLKKFYTIPLYTVLDTSVCNQNDKRRFFQKVMAIFARHVFTVIFNTVLLLNVWCHVTNNMVHKNKHVSNRRITFNGQTWRPNFWNFVN